MPPNNGLSGSPTTLGPEKPTEGSPKKAPFGNRPRISATGTTFATLLVGPDEVKFVVHETLLVHHSAFFRAALQGSFAEAETKTVKITDFKPTIVEIFIHWLYHERFPSKENHDDEGLVALYTNPKDRRKLRSAHRDQSNVLVKIYLFGDMYEIPELRNAAIRSLVSHLGKPSRSLYYSTCNLAFEKLAVHDPLCRLLVNFTVRHKRNRFEPVDGKKVTVSINQTFLIEVVNRWMHIWGSKNQISLVPYDLRVDDYLVKEE